MSLIEVIIAIAVIAATLLIISFAFTQFIKVTMLTTKDIQALYLAEEGLEVARLFRDNGWATSLGSFSVGTSYWLVKDNDVWRATTTPQPLIDGLFDRFFIVGAVSRDSNSDISGGGTVDPNTKMVTVSVYYRGLVGTSTKAISAILTNTF